MGLATQTKRSVQAAIALGGNLGNTQQILSQAVEAIADSASITLLAQSQLYKTAPIGPPQPDYLNACVLVSTTLTPKTLLTRLFDIENKFGRVRVERWGARSLDLDLLFYGDRVIESPLLTVPHPRLHERAFVLVPLADISPNWAHPIFNQTTVQLLAQLCIDYPPQEISLFDAHATNLTGYRHDHRPRTAPASEAKSLLRRS